jgi:hypothetical protein
MGRRFFIYQKYVNLLKKEFREKIYNLFLYILTFSIFLFPYSPDSTLIQLFINLLISSQCFLELSLLR